MASNAPTPCQTPGPTRKAGVSSEIEEEFLHAVDFGDVTVIKKLLDENPSLNVDCSDALGRTPLRLAVKNEHRELVEILLNLSSSGNIHEALLQAIDAGFTTIAETTLKHPRYMDITNRQRRLGDVDGFFTPELGAQFPSYVTPLNLAAQKEQYVIVSLLLQRGETIPKPHKFGCSCQECVNKGKFDQLRMAKCRLDAYRGLASEAYISLCSQDPIQTAMELADELNTLSQTEIIFKAEYTNLVDRLSVYIVKLLDRVWTQRELSVVLDKTGNPAEDEYESLARLRMAIEFEQKKFVAHPNCQQRIIQCWYRGTFKLDKEPWTKRLAIFFLSFILYPFATLVFLFSPNSKCGRFLRLPTVKFVSHSISFLTFLALIINSSRESIDVISNTNTLADKFSHIHQRYVSFRNVTGLYGCGPNFPLRPYHPTITEIIMTTWVIGLIAQECQEIYEFGCKVYCSSGYNCMDFVLLSVYTATYTIRYWTMLQWNRSLHMLETVQDLTHDPEKTESYIYWLNADRRFWVKTDPINMAEGLFAMANILSMSRITYLLPANETLGPMQISLGRMIKDILKFFAIAIIVIAAFMVGLRNLFWYYANRDNIEIDSSKVETPQAVAYYGSELATFRTVFWSIYGRGAVKAVSLGQYNNTLTEDIGQGIDASYHVIMIILLINMFIAMMSRSFDEIAEDSDVEWKFARSALFLDYIKEGRVLPVPLNLLEIPQTLVLWLLRSVPRCAKKEMEEIHDYFPDARRPAIINPRATQLKRRFGTEDGNVNSNGGRISPFISKSKRKSKSTNLYQDVVQRIVQRYIYDVQRQNEQGGNPDEVKNCLVNFEREVMTQWKTQEEGVSRARQTLHEVAKELHTITGKSTSSYLDMICYECDSSSPSEDGPESPNEAHDDSGVVLVHKDNRTYSLIPEDIQLEEKEEAIKVFEDSEGKDEISLFDDIFDFIDDSGGSVKEK